MTMTSHPAPMRTLWGNPRELARALRCPRCPRGILLETRVAGVVARLDCTRCKLAIVYVRPYAS